MSPICLTQSDRDQYSSRRTKGIYYLRIKYTRFHGITKSDLNPMQKHPARIGMTTVNLDAALKSFFHSIHIHPSSASQISS